MISLLKRIVKRIISSFYSLFYGSFGESSRIIKPIRVLGKKFIHIGDGTYIMQGARIEAVEKYADEVFNPFIKIGSNVDIQQRVHITCAERLEIGDNVSILPDVLITDINHPYTDINLPPKMQRLEHFPVSIGEDSIIGMGARILPGVKIGRHCCIGTNAVVTKDVPDYSLAVGIPAKVVKTYDFEKQKWCDMFTKNVYGGGKHFDELINILIRRAS